MFSLSFRKTTWGTIGAVALSCLTATPRLAAASPEKSVNITFTGSGTFAPTPVSGTDALKLAGQQFSVSILANSALTPVRQNRHAIFEPLEMTGVVYSALTGTTPITISSTTAGIAQEIGASEDLFQAQFPVTYFFISATVKAYFILPAGTLSSALIRPFSSVALDSTNGSVSYADSTTTTVLAVQSGTLVATLPIPVPAEKAAVAAPSAVVLVAGAQAVKPRGLPPM
jgi:hypothetical protein